MKNRMSVVDIRAIVAELREQLIGMRLANLYDINKKTYLLKFAKTDEKIHVLIESGIRIHSTDFERDKSKMPSHFVLKMRKYIRTRRLEKLEQLGLDRVVDFTFGMEEKAYHLIVEFFAKGNVVLTDHQYKIITLLRTHSKEVETGLFAVGETYPVSTRLQVEGISKSSLAQTIHTAVEKEKNATTSVEEEQVNQDMTDKQQQKKNKWKKAPSVPTLTMKNVLINNLEYGTGFVDHCLLTADVVQANLNLLDTNQNTTKQILAEVDSVIQSTEVATPILDKLVQAFTQIDDFIHRIKTEKQKGYIILKEIVHQKTLDEVTVENPFATKAEEQNPENPPAEASSTPVVELNDLQLKQIEMMKEEKRLSIKRDQYDDFTPFLFEQVRRKIPTNPEEIKVVEFASFDKCADEFFSAIEAKKIESQKSSVENTVEKKMSKVRREQEQKLIELQQSLDKYEHIANTIEQHYEMVDQAIQVICSALAQSQPWDTIKQIIKEHRDVDPIAAMIHKLKLESSQITVILPPPKIIGSDDESEEESEEEDEDEENDESGDDEEKPKKKEESLKIDIDISMTAHANAAKYYALRKKSAENKEKASSASKRALKKTEQKTTEAAKKVQIKSDITIRRKRFWFEKFYWFITSENYLVLGGRDAQQNELIVKRYMRKGDIYVHADVHGASSCIIKNPTGEPIPPLSLQEAGMFCVCRSVAWDNKVLSSAYWVYDHQVSKTAPSGEYLTLGSFMIRGKKNFMPPSPLVMGLAIMFKVDESCIPNHIYERKPRMSSEEASQYLNSVSENIENDFGEEDSTTTGTMEEEEIATTTNSSTTHPTTTSTSKVDTEDEDSTVHHSSKVTTEEILEIEEEEKPTSPEEESSDKKKSLSAKDKKILQRLKKKGMSEKEAREAILSGNIPEELKSSKKEDQPQESEDKDEKESAVPAHKPKGMKRGKWKKLKTKYADQDEEERQIMIELIGNKPKEKPKEEDKTLQKKKEDEQRQKRKEQEEIKKVLQDENIPFMDEEEKEKLTEIDSLTGQPREDDIFLFAIPVCAPYSCLKNYTYKVKVVPGNSKKGKAGKEAISILRGEARNYPLVEACIKAIDDTDIGASLVGNCRIATGAARKSTFNTQKKKKKPAAPSE